MVKRRPHTAILNWSEGGTYTGGKYSGGVPLSLTIPCRIEEMVGFNIEIDGRKLTVKYKVFIDNIDLSSIDQQTLTITFNGIKHKILKAIAKQTHVKLWI
jgi:hypothetical protein